MHQLHVSDDALKMKLRKEDPYFAELEVAHRKLDDELMRYELHIYLSPEEEQTRRELQKKKLALKDQLEALLHKQALPVN